MNGLFHPGSRRHLGCAGPETPVRFPCPVSALHLSILAVAEPGPVVPGYVPGRSNVPFPAISVDTSRGVEQVRWYILNYHKVL